MLNWIKKRCRRKSAPSARENKIKEIPTLYGLHTRTDPADHDYEEIDDVCPGQLAYAVVTLTDLKSEKDVFCPVCRKEIKGDLVCFCSVLNSNQISDDEEDLPEKIVALSCSTPIDERTRSKRRQPDFSKRPLPEIPNDIKKNQPTTLIRNFSQWSSTDESNSSSSGYFDSFLSKTDSSSDDSLSFEFQKMMIRQRSREVMNRQRSQLSVRNQSPPRPRMGCRALSRNQNMRRCRSTSRANTTRFEIGQRNVFKQQTPVYENLPSFNRKLNSGIRASSSGQLPNNGLQHQRQRFGSVRSHVKLYENV